MKLLVSFAAISLIVSPGIVRAQTAAERQACQTDYEKYCPGVQQGGGRIIKCLSEHLDQLTPQCKTVVEANMPQ